MNCAHFHLPGLFEFTELYRSFLRLWQTHRDWFYDWCEIDSIYGAPAQCIWGGGRVGFGDASAEEALALLTEFGLSGRLTFSNSLLQEHHLGDKLCNRLCALFEKSGNNGVIVHSELLTQYLQETYPGLYLVSSTTKVLTDFQELSQEVRRKEFRYVVPDFRLNRQFADLQALTQKEKIEFLCNECCDFGCKSRKHCYETVSRKALGLPCPDHRCAAPGSEAGYRFSAAMKNPGFIGIADIQNRYLPMGFSQFKLEGRGLGSAMVLEFLLYYLTKPEYHIHVREEIYLDSMLDLF